MTIVELHIGQDTVRPPDYVAVVLKEIGYSTGRMSPLVPMAVDPTHRAKVEAMLHDCLFQREHADPSAVPGWNKAIAVIELVLRASEPRYRQNLKRSLA